MSGNFLGDLQNAARDNPVSAALIGIGAVWWLSGRAGLRPDGPALREATRSVGEAARGYGENIAGAASSAMDAGRRMASDVADRTSKFAEGLTDHLPRAGSSAYDNLRSRISDMFEQQPLLLGVVGVAVGAGLAAALPQTEFEGQALGEVSDRVKSTLSDVASTQADRASDLVGNVVDAARTEAGRQGLTPDGLKAAAEDISQKVGRVAESVANAADQRS